MTSEIFHLEPFEPIAADIELSVSGKATLEGTQLAIVYLLSGELEKVAIAPPHLEGTRRDRLWEQTCFEFFLTDSSKPTADTPYWEFNLSPSKDWNVFVLDGYRQGLREESTVSYLPFDIERQEESLRLRLTMDVSPLARTNQPLQFGVSAVILLETGQQTFWAIAHPGPAADFHHHQSFVLSLRP
jgi:hypothetical protein